MIHFQDHAQLQSLLDENFSDWSPPLLVTQTMIDEFAQISGDTLWIHTDPAKCKEMGMGSTIAHGFLILSLLSSLPAGEDVVGKVTGYRQIMNYGSDKLRFLAPVPVDSEIQARRKVIAAVVEENKTKVTLQWQVNVVGQSQPSLLYDMTFVFI